MIPVITFLVLVFVILIVVSANYAKSKVYQSETESALERTKEVKETIIQLIEQTQILAGIASEDIHVQNGYKSGNTNEHQKFIKSQMNLEDFYEAIFLTDFQGRLIAHPNESAIGMDITSYQAWKAITEDNQNSYIDKSPIISPVSKNPIIVISHKIEDENNNFLGIIGYTINLSKLAELFIDDYKIAQNGYFYMIDAKNEVIMHPRKEIILNEKYMNLEWHQSVLDSKEDFGVVKYVFEGDKKTLSFAKIKGLDWYLMASMFDKDLAKVGTGIGNIILIISIVIMLLLALMISYLLNQKISTPIKRVLVGLDLIANNDFTLKAKDDLINRQDEIGLLANAYEKTRTQVASALKNVIEGIKTLNDKSKMLEKTADNLVHNSMEMNSQSQMVSASSEQISSNANVIASSAEEASVSVSTVAAATEQLSSNINQVASAAEQTSASVNSTVNEINNLSNNIGQAGK
ncbi:MAG: methyl-accepting chemotaxis protein, partial [Candidatus Cloacimonetes bacterium]|nr:methyl-accepting chemotaxis protein [Candidatus Cloacimonadota bacterium]